MSGGVLCPMATAWHSPTWGQGDTGSRMAVPGLLGISAQTHAWTDGHAHTHTQSHRILESRVTPPASFLPSPTLPESPSRSCSPPPLLPLHTAFLLCLSPWSVGQVFGRQDRGGKQDTGHAGTPPVSSDSLCPLLCPCWAPGLVWRRARRLTWAPTGSQGAATRELQAANLPWTPGASVAG